MVASHAFAGFRERASELWAEPNLAELNGPDRSVGPTDGLVILRVAMFLAFGALCLVLDEWEVSRIAAAALAGLAVLQPLSAMVIPRRQQLVFSHVFTDVLAAVTISTLNTEYVLPASMAVIAIGVSYAASAPVRRVVPVVGVAVAGAGAISIVGGVEHTERIVLVALLLLAFFAHLGYQARDLIRKSRRDLHVAMHAAGGLTHLSDARTATFEIGGDVLSVMGFTNAEWRRLSPHEMVHADDLDGMWINPADLIDGQILDRTARFRHKDGHWVWLRDVSRVVMHGKRPYLHGFLIDVTAERIGLQKVTDEATTDQLTGLLNRRALIDDLGDLEGQSGHALILIDLNRFKEINDTLGHDAGDQLLREVADRLRACVRPGDHLSRLGGDEFAVIMREVTDVTRVIAAVDRLALEVSRPIELNGVSLTTSLSAGIAESSHGESMAITMLRHADLAMYAAKRSGRDVVVFDQELEAQLERRIQLLEALPGALDDGSLTLQYQPIVECRTGEIIGVEGLARWQHPTFGKLTPDAFLDVVLLSERSADFTRAMVSTALRTWLLVRETTGHSVVMAVNMPVPVLEDPAFESWFVAERSRLGADDVDLVFEVAEGDLHHGDAMSDAIGRLTALGVSISVDDFGTGNATFERLRWPNVKQLKIDRGMVSAASANDRDHSILESVAELALSLDYEVVAEGVETTEQFEMVEGMGITSVQGWLFAPAVPLDELLALLKDGAFTHHPSLASRLDASNAR